MDNRYFELDQQITAEIKAELHAQGIRSYPVTCTVCQGDGFVTTGVDEGLHVCPECNGEREVEMMIDFS